MTLPASGAISLSQVNTELGLSSTANISMGNSNVRTLFGVSSGAISMSNGYGKANQFSFSIASNTANLDVRAAALSAGWNGTSKVVCTINSGVYVYSNSTGSYACTVSGSFPNGVQLINNGMIVGRGGNGGNAGRSYQYSNGTPYSYRIFPTAGASGGPALYVGTAVTIQNNGSINGGGGGGGGSWGSAGSCKGPFTVWSGGGGGGGIGGSTGGITYGIALNGCGCPNGAGGQAGSGGTFTAAGSGGTNTSCFWAAGYGGNGGGYGSSGATAGTTTTYNDPGYPGGSGGAAVVGNGNISWTATGTRNGSIS